GWWRLDVRLVRRGDERLERDQAEIRADFGEGWSEEGPLERICWSEELHEREIYFHLPRTARALRFQPIAGRGEFVVEEFAARRLSRAASLVTALHRKLRLVRDYNCTGRVLRRGLTLLFTGRLGEFRRKLFKGLPDVRYF